jgi:putative DNA primase/helicase
MAEAETDQEEKTERQEAEEWLLTLLADGPARRTEIMKAARENGFSEATLKRASQSIGVHIKRAGFGDGSCWSLPDQPPPETA